MMGTLTQGGTSGDSGPKLLPLHKCPISRKRLPATCPTAGFRRHFPAAISARLYEPAVPVLRLETISEINLRVLLAQVTEVRNSSQRFAGGALNQLRRKKFASVLMDVLP